MSEETFGVAAGAFDLLHPGHLLFLTTAKKACDKLFVALHVDPSVERSHKNKPVQSVFERFVALDLAIDPFAIVPYETEDDLLTLFKILRDSSSLEVRRFVGQDHAERDPYLAMSEALGVKTVYVSRSHPWSSSNLRHRAKNS